MNDAPPMRAPGDPKDRTVAEFEEAFRQIHVAGVDLAAVSRLPLYLALQTKQAFASPSLRERAAYTLLSTLVFLRARMEGASPAASPPAPLPPAPLFFFEGESPSVQESLHPVLARFGAEEARAAANYARAPADSRTHAWIDIRPFFPARIGASLRGIEKAIRKAQRGNANAVFRRASFRGWLSRSAIRLASAAPAVRTLFEMARPTVLVTASDASFWGRCVTLEATARGIPSLTLQHGMMVGTSAYAPVVSSRFAAWGAASARWLEARGVPPDKLIVTGAPRLDEIVNRTSAPREEVARELGADPSSRWIVLATNPIAFARNAALLAAAREGVRTWGERAVLVVKLHPSEDPGPYREAVSGDPEVVIVPHGAVHLYDLLASADALLTFHSSVGLEAMLLDKPVVSLEAFGEENPLSYARDGAAGRARNAEELADLLRREVAPGQDANAREERRARFIRDNLLAADGKSARRVRDLIRTLAEEESP